MEFCDLVPKGWHIVATGVNPWLQSPKDPKPRRGDMNRCELMSALRDYPTRETLIPWVYTHGYNISPLQGFSIISCARQSSGFGFFWRSG